MKRKTIKLTEGTLRNIVKNSVMRVLRESFDDKMPEDYADFEEFAEEPDEYDDIEEYGDEDVEELDHLKEEDVAGIQATVDHLNELTETLKPSGKVYGLLQDAVDSLQEIIDMYGGTF